MTALWQNSWFSYEMDKSYDRFNKMTITTCPWVFDIEDVLGDIQD